MDSKDQFRVYLKAASQTASSGFHVDDEMLFAYKRGAVQDSERQQIQDHFIACTECLERFRDVSEFVEASTPDSDQPDRSQIGNEWNLFRSRAFSLKRPLSSRAPGLSRWFARSAPLLVASVSLVVALVIAGWVLLNQNGQAEQVKRLEEENRLLIEQLNRSEQITIQPRENPSLDKRIRELEEQNQRLKEEVSSSQQRLAQLRGPQLNAPIFDVYEERSAARSTAGNANRVVISQKASTVILILNGTDLPEQPDYSVEMIDSSGRSLWQKSGLKRDGLGNFVLTIGQESLRQDEMQLKVYGEEGKQSSLIGTFRLSIRRQQ